MTDSQGRLPHAFPYQGSKRGLASQILRHFPDDIDCLIEPFCGSAAVSVAAATRGLANRFWLNDVNAPLMKLWEEILERPAELAIDYGELWRNQHFDRRKFFDEVRAKFNSTGEPRYLLYLLARIVKGSVRYSANGRFNQSPDNRRSGMRPTTMRDQLLGVAALLAGRTTLTATDFRRVVREARPTDLVYMDPPYQGTSFTRDHRYCRGVAFDEFVDVLATMNDAGISYIVSYDGRTGSKRHGQDLPRRLFLRHLEVNAGRSTQSTLLGKVRETVESLYLSPALDSRLGSGLSSPVSTESRDTPQLGLL